MRLALFAPLLAALAASGPAQPGQDCVALPLSYQVEGADSVFVGRAISVEPWEGAPDWGGEIGRFVVEEWVKGSGADTVTVAVEGGELAGYGPDLRPGVRYVVLAETWPGSALPVSPVCGASSEAAWWSEEELEALRALGAASGR